MPRWSVTLLNVVLGAAAAAVLTYAIAGPDSAPTPAAAAPTVGRTSLTTPTTPVKKPPVTTLPPTTTKPATTVPVTTVPVTTPPRTAPPVSVRRPVFTVPTTAASTTTTTSTTIAPIGGHLPVPPSTLPLRTKAQSAHVSPVFPALSGGGFFVALVIMASRFVMTRRGRRRG